MRHENFYLKVYSITLTAILAYLLLSSLKSENSNQKFNEITVERINIIEPDGKLKMVLSNKASQHPGMMDGKSFPSRERPPGIVFFNEEQDEIGLFGYHGNKQQGGNNVFFSLRISAIARVVVPGPSKKYVFGSTSI